LAQKSRRRKGRRNYPAIVIPAYAGIQAVEKLWILASARMTK